jgi:hypothetical protein
MVPAVIVAGSIASENWTVTVAGGVVRIWFAFGPAGVAVGEESLSTTKA